MTSAQPPLAVTNIGRVVLAIPIFDDWNALAALLPRLDDVLARTGLVVRLLIVDDGSTADPPAEFGAQAFRALQPIEMLRLRRNMGHQRAIAIALAYAHERIGPDALLVMDGDGEDAPEDVPRLLAHLATLDARTVVFAERTRRSESLTFRVFYGVYRFAHVLLTGIPVRVGNFSAVPAGALSRLVVVPELWNHYAAAVFNARLRRATVPTERATRLTGRSTMNFVALVAHGLSALSVHAETVGVRLFVATSALLTVIAVLLLAVLVIRLGTTLAVPGWTTSAVGLLAVLFMQAIGLAVFFVFIVLHGRSQAPFIPLRDYAFFVERVTPLSRQLP